MNDDFDEEEGLLDKDPALDFILYKNMEQENNRLKSNSGCFGIALFLLLPIGSIFFILATS